MFKMLKVLLLCVLCLFCFILISCKTVNTQIPPGIYIPPFIGDSEFEKSNHTQVLDEYKTAFSIAYLNADNTKSLYIFGSPIAYEKNNILHYINNQILPIDNEKLLDEGYVYTNAENEISTLFPKNLNENPIQILSKEIGIKVSPTNPSGKVKFNLTRNSVEYKLGNAVLCSNVTAIGINNTLKGKKLSNEYSFSYEITDGYTIDSSVLEYLLIKNENDVKGVIYKPILYVESKESKIAFSYNSTITYKKEVNKYIITYTLDPAFLLQHKGSVITMSFNVNCYRKKQPDSSVYSGSPQDNKYLSEFSFVGNSLKYGVGQTYVRFENLSKMKIPLENIIGAEYGINNLIPVYDDCIIVINRVIKDWCSLTTNWYVKSPFEERVSQATIAESQIYYFNITELYKLWINNIGVEESEYNPLKGFVLNFDNNTGSVVLASNDNSQYAPFLKITYR